MHTLKSSDTETNGKKFNFFRWIETRNDLKNNEKKCSIGTEPSHGANYFCRAMYGATSKSISFKKGTYSDSGSKGWIVSKSQECISSLTGSSFENTKCLEKENDSGQSSQKCYIHQCTKDMDLCKTVSSQTGLYDIVCSQGKLPGFMNISIYS